MKKIPKDAYTVLFFALGIACTVLSFVFCFGSSPLSDPLTAIFCVIDLIFLFANAYFLAERYSATHAKRVANTCLSGLAFLSLILSIGCMIFEESITLPIFLLILQVAVFLGPILILTIPIIILIAWVLGG